MQALITPEEFAARAVGLPWIRWRSDWFAADCYGLVLLYYRSVLGIELGQVPQLAIADGFFRTRDWIEGPPEPGSAMFMTWRDGAPTHCGILLPRGDVIHSQEGHRRPEGGSARVTRLAAMARACADLRFYRCTRC